MRRFFSMTSIFLFAAFSIFNCKQTIKKSDANLAGIRSATLKKKKVDVELNHIFFLNDKKDGNRVLKVEYINFKKSMRLNDRASANPYEEEASDEIYSDRMNSDEDLNADNLNEESEEGAKEKLIQFVKNIKNIKEILKSRNENRLNLKEKLEYFMNFCIAPMAVNEMMKRGFEGDSSYPICNKQELQDVAYRYVGLKTKSCIIPTAIEEDTVYAEQKLRDIIIEDKKDKDSNSMESQPENENVGYGGGDAFAEIDLPSFFVVNYISRSFLNDLESDMPIAIRFKNKYKKIFDEQLDLVLSETFKFTNTNENDYCNKFLYEHVRD